MNIDCRGGFALRPPEVFLFLTLALAVHLRSFFISGLFEILLLSFLFYSIFVYAQLDKMVTQIGLLSFLFLTSALASLLFGSEYGYGVYYMATLVYCVVSFLALGSYFLKKGCQSGLIAFVNFSSLLSLFFVICWASNLGGYDLYDNVLYIRGDNVRVSGFLGNPNY